MCGCGGTKQVRMPSGVIATCSCAAVVMKTIDDAKICAAPISIPERMAPTVARLRAKFNHMGGNNLYKVFMVWTRWDGGERGAGKESEFLRLELVPTPEIPDLTSIGLDLRSVGTLPNGSVRLSRIYHALTADMILGSMIPESGFFDHLDSCGKPAFFGGKRGVPVEVGGLSALEAARYNAGLTEREQLGRIPTNVSFFYEIVESNSSARPARMKFRPSTTPYREKGSITWSVGIERISEDRSRGGKSQIGRDHDDDD